MKERNQRTFWESVVTAFHHAIAFHRDFIAADIGTGALAVQQIGLSHYLLQPATTAGRKSSGHYAKLCYPNIFAEIAPIMRSRNRQVGGSPNLSLCVIVNT